MNIHTAKKIIDTILDMYDADTDFIGKHSKGLVLDFIGGEPLLEAKLIENICDYYFDECLRRNIPLAPFTRFSFATNGLLWFTEDAQHLFKKYHDFISLTVSIDGIQELHDKYRIDQYGKGSFEKAYIAYLDGRDKYGWNNSKMTFTPGSVHYMYDSIKMMIENGCNDILCNFAYEPKYTIQDAKNIYFELKKVSDYMIQNKYNNYISILDEYIGNFDNTIDNYCGGTGKMIAFSSDGKAYPCIRYMPISIGNEKSSKICIGDCFNGIYKTNDQLKIKKELDSITRKSQSTKECMECPVSTGCGWCSGYNYELYGTANKRCTNICYSHKGRVLASCYYYNKRHVELNDVNPKKINLPYNEVVDILGKEEADYLFNLEKEAFNK
jgi:radical SAM peptide maturase (CXXX-repeat target family)